MGWGRTLFLGDIGNRLDIEDTEIEISKLKRSLGHAYHKDISQDQKIEMLIEENAELKLYLASIIQLLIAKSAITKEELEKVVQKVDASDGSTDGAYKGGLV